MILTWQAVTVPSRWRRAHVVDLVAPVVARRHVLRARLDPLDRAAEPLGEREHQALLAVGLELRAEATAHVRRHHAQLVLGDAEHAGEDEARDVRDLGGRESVSLSPRSSRSSSAVDRRAGGAVVHEAVLDDTSASASARRCRRRRRPLVRSCSCRTAPRRAARRPRAPPPGPPRPASGRTRRSRPRRRRPRCAGSSPPRPPPGRPRA